MTALKKPSNPPAKSVQNDAAKQIDDVLKFCAAAASDKSFVTTSLIVTKLNATIDRLAPKGSTYKRSADELSTRQNLTNANLVPCLVGVLKALKSDYESNYLENIEGLIRGDLFADFMDMAQHLLSEGYKDAAAVIVGGVLEEHLRKLCVKNGISIHDNSGKSLLANSLSTELYKADVITGLDHKNATGWIDLRNKAAHAHYSSYTDQQVQLLLQSVLDFLTRVPA